jgi:outer membrane protein OmpA-like peptidoglycan-associated protein
MRQPLPNPVADVAGIELAGGLVAIDAASRQQRAAPVGSVAFKPQSAMLTPDAVAHLVQFLAVTEAPGARIKIVGEAAAPALALDRALAVGLALVQSGVPADRLELTLAQSGSSDQARLFLAAPEL